MQTANSLPQNVVIFIKLAAKVEFTCAIFSKSVYVVTHNHLVHFNKPQSFLKEHILTGSYLYKNKMT